MSLHSKLEGHNEQSSPVGRSQVVALARFNFCPQMNVGFMCKLSLSTHWITLHILSISRLFPTSDAQLPTPYGRNCEPPWKFTMYFVQFESFDRIGLIHERSTSDIVQLRCSCTSINAIKYWTPLTVDFPWVSFQRLRPFTPLYQPNDFPLERHSSHETQNVICAPKSAAIHADVKHLIFITFGGTLEGLRRPRGYNKLGKSQAHDRRSEKRRIIQGRGANISGVLGLWHLRDRIQYYGAYSFLFNTFYKSWANISVHSQMCYRHYSSERRRIASLRRKECKAFSRWRLAAYVDEKGRWSLVEQEICELLQFKSLLENLH